jgi:hypothetical protein
MNFMNGKSYKHISHIKGHFMLPYNSSHVLLFYVTNVRGQTQLITRSLMLTNLVNKANGKKQG